MLNPNPRFSDQNFSIQRWSYNCFISVAFLLGRLDDFKSQQSILYLSESSDKQILSGKEAIIREYLLFQDSQIDQHVHSSSSLKNLILFCNQAMFLNLYSIYVSTVLSKKLISQQDQIHKQNFMNIKSEHNIVKNDIFFRQY